MTFRSTRLVCTALWVFLGACGGGAASSGPSSAAGAAPGGEAHHGGESQAHTHHGPGLPPGAVSRFHGVLAPLWHSEPGAERDARTCQQRYSLRQHAADILATPAPESVRGREGAWTEAAGGLDREVSALDVACGDQDRRAVPEHLEAVHTAFHRLIELLRAPR